MLRKLYRLLRHVNAKFTACMPLLPAKACGQWNFAPTKSFIFFGWRCRLTEVDLHNGCASLISHVNTGSYYVVVSCIITHCLLSVESCCSLLVRAGSIQTKVLHSLSQALGRLPCRTLRKLV